MSQQQQSVRIPVDPSKSIATLLTSQKDQIKLALPKHMTPDRMLRISLTELRKSVQLQNANPLSFLAAVIQCAQLGLEPGSALGHVYLIPYGKEVQVIIGYRGEIELARRSGQIESIGAYCVYERDHFELTLGLDPDIKHKPEWKGERGDIVAVYAVAKLKGGGTQFEVMSRAQVEDIKAKATAGKRSSPWFDHFDEMARKTVIRRLFKYLPVSVEMARAMEVEDRGEAPIEITNYETGELLQIEVPEDKVTTADVRNMRRNEALSSVWGEIEGLKQNPADLIKMSFDDVLASPPAKQESVIVFLRDWLNRSKDSQQQQQNQKT